MREGVDEEGRKEGKIDAAPPKAVLSFLLAAASEGRSAGRLRSRGSRMARAPNSFRSSDVDDLSTKTICPWMKLIQH